MSGIDPAWFYSSLAQASAAIVGLVGAILGSRVLDHLAQVRQERVGLDEKISFVTQYLKPRRDGFLAFREFLLKGIAEHAEAIRRGQNTRSFTEEIGWNFTQGTKQQEVEIVSHLPTLKKDLELVESLLEALPKFVGDVEEMSSTLDRFGVILTTLSESHSAKALLENYYGHLKDLQSRVSRFRTKLLPRSLVIVFLLLGWLTLVGIVWPLLALPGLPEKALSKTLMLIALGVGLLGLIGFFGFQLLEIRQLGRLHWK